MNDKLKLAVIGIVIHQGKILIGKKKKSSGKFLSGKWHLVGGNEEISDFENINSFQQLIERIAQREIYEESGLSILVIRQIKITDRIKVKENEIINNSCWVYCKLDETSTIQPVPKSDLVEVKWIPLENVFKELDQEAIERMPVEVINFIIAMQKSNFK